MNVCYLNLDKRVDKGVDDEQRALGHYRCGRRDRGEKWSRFSKGGAFGIGRGDAPQRRQSGRLRSSSRRAEMVRRRAQTHRRPRRGRCLHRHPARLAPRLYARGRSSWQAGLCRETDGAHGGGVRGDDRGVQRGGRAALRRVLPPSDAPLS